MTLLIIQARMASRRLPNKVMLKIFNKPILWHVVNRVKKSKYVDKIVIATSSNIKDNSIRNFCTDNQIECFSGSENDVLDRFYKLINFYELHPNDNIVRITADCPLIDPVIIDKVISHHISHNFDYTSNTVQPTFPDGLDCEIIKVSVLKKIWSIAKLNSEREHVTLFIRNHFKDFNIGSYENFKNLSNLRWTLDEKEDFLFISRVFQLLYKPNDIFYTDEILFMLKANPHLSNINSKFIRNEGLTKSILDDSI